MHRFQILKRCIIYISSLIFGRNMRRNTPDRTDRQARLKYTVLKEVASTITPPTKVAIHFEKP